MPTGDDGQHYRSHGQAARFGGKKEPSEDNKSNEGEDAVGKGKNVIAIKHSGDESGPKPPFHVKHEDGHVEGPMNSKEELMAHLDKHMGGDEYPAEEQMDSDFGSEGSKQAIDSLLG